LFLHKQLWSYNEERENDDRQQDHGDDRAPVAQDIAQLFYEDYECALDVHVNSFLNDLSADYADYTDFIPILKLQTYSDHTK